MLHHNLAVRLALTHKSSPVQRSSILLIKGIDVSSFTEQEVHHLTQRRRGRRNRSLRVWPPGCSPWRTPVPQCGHWGRRDAAPCARRGPTRWRCSGAGWSPRRSAERCWPRPRAAASASSCLVRSRRLSGEWGLGLPPEEKTSCGGGSPSIIFIFPVRVTPCSSLCFYWFSFKGLSFGLSPWLTALIWRACLLLENKTIRHVNDVDICWVAFRVSWQWQEAVCAKATWSAHFSKEPVKLRLYQLTGSVGKWSQPSHNHIPHQCLQVLQQKKWCLPHSSMPQPDVEE